MRNTVKRWTSFTSLLIGISLYKRYIGNTLTFYISSRTETWTVIQVYIPMIRNNKYQDDDTF